MISGRTRVLMLTAGVAVAGAAHLVAKPQADRPKPERQKYPADPLSSRQVRRAQERLAAKAHARMFK